MTVYAYKLDFEIGTLAKSPCKECEKRPCFPQCIEECDILDEIQTLLAETRSMSRNN